MPSKRKAKIIIEVMYKADYCLPCHYMDEMVRSVLPNYADRVEYRRVDFLKGNGKERFLELSCLLFGDEGVHKHCRLAPVPSLWINGELFFRSVPPQPAGRDHTPDPERSHRHKTPAQVSARHFWN